MSRSGYSEDYGIDDQWALIRYRGMVASATRGKRGQQLFKDILRGMAALPVKELHAEVLATQDGAMCAMGAGAMARGVDLVGYDPEDYERVAGKLDVADCLAQEIAWDNDECGPHDETPEHRFWRMRRIITRQIKDPLRGIVWC